MNYRHAFHAGNFADLVKHAALLRLLAELQRDPAPLRVIDTHGGSGLYDLGGPEAARSGEAQAGVLRLLADPAPPPDMTRLVQAVREANGGGAARLYPGSPWLIARALRPGDAYAVFEMQPDEHRRLAKTLAGRAGVETRCADGFAGAPGAMRPGGRHLVLIDPPFERADDYGRSCDLAQAVRGRDPAAAVLIWVPLKDLETLDAFVRDLEDAVEAPVLVGETRMRPLDDPMKMNGCALAAVGAPSGFETALSAICGAVAETKPGGVAKVWSVS